MSDPDHAEEITAYLHGELDEAGLCRLEEILRRSPQARGLLIKLSRLEFDLRATVGRVPGQAVPGTSRSSRRYARRQRTGQRRPLVWLAVAACVAIATGLLLFAGLQPRPASPVAVVSADTTVTMALDGRQVPVSGRTGVAAGTRISSGTGTAELRFVDDQSTLLLQADSVVTLLPGASLARLAVEQGRVECRVSPQAAGSVFVVETPHAYVTVHGTRFEVTVRPDGTTVSVAEGEVRFTRRIDRRAIVLAAGATAATDDRRCWQEGPVAATPTRPLAEGFGGLFYADAVAVYGRGSFVSEGSAPVTVAELWRFTGKLPAAAVGSVAADGTLRLSSSRAQATLHLPAALAVPEGCDGLRLSCLMRLEAVPGHSIRNAALQINLSLTDLAEPLSRLELPQAFRHPMSLTVGRWYRLQFTYLQVGRLPDGRPIWEVALSQDDRIMTRMWMAGTPEGVDLQIGHATALFRDLVIDSVRLRP